MSSARTGRTAPTNGPHTTLSEPVASPTETDTHPFKRQGWSLQTTEVPGRTFTFMSTPLAAEGLAEISRQERRNDDDKPAAARPGKRQH